MSPNFSSSYALLVSTPRTVRSEEGLNAYLLGAGFPDDVRFFRVRSETRARLKEHVAGDDLVFGLVEDTVHAAHIYAPPRASRDLPGSDREALRLKRKGWSDAKILRALGEMSELRTRSKPSGLNPQIRQALALLAREHGRVALLIHKFFRSDRFDDFAVVSVRSISVEALLGDSGAVGVDVWTVVAREEGGAR